MPGFTTKKFENKGFKATLKLFCIILFVFTLPFFLGIRCNTLNPQLDMKAYSLAKALKIIYVKF